MKKQVSMHRKPVKAQAVEIIEYSGKRTKDLGGDFFLFFLRKKRK